MTMFSSMLAWKPPQRRNRSAGRKPSRQLTLESLEDRSLLSVMVYNSADVPKNIVSLATATSTINIPDSYAIGDVNVTLDISHTWDSDLQVYLVGPDGTRIRLIDSVGGSEDNFTNTTLDDQASTTIGSGTAPFTGSFKPSAALSAFIGRDAAGTWTLEVYDQFSQDEGTLNSWSLTIDSVTDDFANFFAGAQTINLTPPGDATQLGTIDYSFDVDVFRLTAITTGFMSIHQDAAAGSSVDSFLEVYDSTQTLIQSDDDGGGFPNSFVYFPVIAGQTYYIRARAYSSTSGDYQLSITTGQDDFGNTFASASTLTLSPAGAATQTGTIEQSGDVDMFRFTATASGLMTIRQDQVGPGTLDSFLTVYDSSKTQLGSDDDGGGFPNSLVQIAVTAGQTYYVRAGASSLAAAGDESGDYQLTFSTAPDDFGNTFADSSLISLSGSGSATQLASIEFGKDVDMFRVVANVSGIMTIHLDATGASTLDPYLRVYESDLSLLIYDDDGGPGLNSLVTFGVTAGQTFYLRASGYSTTAGAYQMSITTAPDDHGNTFATATPVTLSTGLTTHSGSIEAIRDVDFFTFVANATGIMTIRQDAASSTLDTYLEVYGSDQVLITSDDDGGSGTNSQLHIYVTAGNRYYVRASVAPGVTGTAVTGAYQLTFNTASDDFGNTFASAHTIGLNAAGAGNQSGVIEANIDVDMFRVVARVSGIMVIQQNAASGSSLDSALEVYDANQTLLNSNDDTNGYNSEVSVRVVAGRTYYIRAGVSEFPLANDFGAYQITIKTDLDDFGNTFASAERIDLSASGAATQTGVIEVSSDVDMFVFQATVTGYMSILQQAGAGSSINSLLTIYDVGHNEIDVNDNGGGGRNALAFIPVLAGQTYYIKAASTDSTKGSYKLTLTSTRDDFGNTFGAAHTVSLSPAGAGTQHGVLEVPIDLDMFRFTAQVSGWMTVTVPTSTNILAYDASQTLLDEGSNRVLFQVVAGQSYFLQYGDGTRTGVAGSYLLNFVTSATPPDDFGDTFDDAHLIPKMYALTNVFQDGFIEEVGDTDVFWFVARSSGVMNVDLSAGSTSNLAGSMRVYDAAHQMLGAGTSFTFKVERDGVYFVQVSAQTSAPVGMATGRYSLHFYLSPTGDDFGNTFAAAHRLTLSRLGTARQVGTLEKSGDVDMFSFVAPITGRMMISTQGIGGGSLSALLELFDSAQNRIAGGAAIEIDVVEGQTYYLRSSDLFDGVGAYLVSFEGITAATTIQTVDVDASSLAGLSGLENDNPRAVFTSSQSFVPLAGNSITVSNIYLATNNSGSVGGAAGSMVAVSASPDYEALFSSLPSNGSGGETSSLPAQALFDENGVLVFVNSATSATGPSGEGPKNWPIASLFPMTERTWAFIATLLPNSSAERDPETATTPIERPMQKDLDELFLPGQLTNLDKPGATPTSRRELPRPGSASVEFAEEMADLVIPRLSIEDAESSAAALADSDAAPGSRPWLATLLAALALLGAGQTLVRPDPLKSRTP